VNGRSLIGTYHTQSRNRGTVRRNRGSVSSSKSRCVSWLTGNMKVSKIVVNGMRASPVFVVPAFHATGCAGLAGPFRLVLAVKRGWFSLIRSQTLTYVWNRSSIYPWQSNVALHYPINCPVMVK